MNVPRLRFKNDGREFPTWEEKPFQDVCKINQGLQIPISERFKEKGEGRHFYITNEFLKKDSDVQYFIENPPSSVLCSESDVLMTRTGNTGKVVTGVNGAFHNNFFKINYDKEALNKTFLCEFLSREKTQFLILKLAGTSTIPDLNHSDFYKITIHFPSLPEQTKIANFLTSIDEKIFQLTQKYDLLKQYKKGVMQQIFSQQLRFKDDDGREFPEWEVEQLGALVKVYDGTHMTPDYQDQGIPFYSVEHVTNNNFSETKFIAREIFEKENKRVKLEKGDILMTRIGDIGTPKYIDWDVEASFYVSLALLKQSKKINSLYLSHYIRTNLFQNELHQRTIHVAFPKKINLGEISNCLVHCPSLTEQTKIANFLTAIDNMITHTKTQLNAVKLYKKGLLQQLFI